MTAVGRRSWRSTVLRLGVALIGLVLAARLFQIQVLAHEDYSRRAEAQWVHPQRIEPRRGNLYDCNRQPLALSVTTWRVGVSLARVSDRAELVTLLADALGLQTRSVDRKLGRAKVGHVVLENEVVLDSVRLALLAQDAAVTLEERRSRFYPRGAVGAALIGFYRQDEQRGDISTGLERGLASSLAGIPGRAQQLASAHPGRSLGKAVIEAAQHGSHLVLTVDADLQRICEVELERSVAACEASGGSVLIVAPQTGDILAAASWPLLDDRQQPGNDPAVWNNRNFTHQYEPGSVFKLITAASLLGRGAVDTATVFDCDDIHFDGYEIRNSEGHIFGHLAFSEAFVHSSNIYFARAVTNLGPEEFYRDLLAFGFNQRSVLPYPGQAKGLLQRPVDWSRRSRATIAIGQEIAVTPLQLVMAAASVASDGWLYAPRIVREVLAADGSLLRECPPVRLRRVMPASLAAYLRRVLARTVDEGTGKAARSDWIRLGGKTGTAQKSRDGRGYTDDCYIASFAGLVPADQPRLVILTILDEPAMRCHYASQSAVPLFANIVREIRRSTERLTDVVSPDRHLIVSGGPREIEVPDVMYLMVDNAAERLRRSGLTPVGDLKCGQVVQQVPGPGSHCVAGARVELTVATQGVAGALPASVCPDLTGLSHREVRSLAARLGVTVQVSGSGYVVSQKPAVGATLVRGGIAVKMAMQWP